MYNACFFHKVELIDPCNGKDIALPLVFTYNSLDMGANKVWQASQNDAQAQQQYVELQNFGLKADKNMNNGSHPENFPCVDHIHQPSCAIKFCDMSLDKLCVKDFTLNTLNLDFWSKCAEMHQSFSFTKK